MIPPPIAVVVEPVTDVCAQDPVSIHASEPHSMPEAAEQAKVCFEAVLEHGPKIQIDHYLVYTTRT